MQQLPPNDSVTATRFAVIPTPVRLDADPELTGRGVTIAFLDSGFYRHPDLTEPEDRILAFEDVSRRRSTLAQWGQPRPWDWHGTQTSVVAAGNGHLSGGLYRGIASEANVVLVKVGSEGRIGEEHIARGFEWVLANQERYNIRIVNASLGADEDLPSKQSLADQAAEEAIARGIVVVAAAGNSGCTPEHNTKPPGNSPSVITVGGYDDKNVLGNESPGTYCSSFGPTADGIVKPEVIAPAIWIAAPILPDTEQFQTAGALCRLVAQPDYVLEALAAGKSDNLEEAVVQAWRESKVNDLASGAPADVTRAWLDEQIKGQKIIGSHYQHVDGTSFAAPIVSSIVAQMIQANPSLTPRAIKHLLISTASRIAGAPLIWQGYGAVRARRVVRLGREFEMPPEERYFQPPRIRGDRLVFYFNDNEAQEVALVGAFNDWDTASLPLQRNDNGVWRVAIPEPPVGRYPYKFLIDGNRWVEDPSNGLKEPDTHGGLNSILEVAGEENIFAD